MKKLLKQYMSILFDEHEPVWIVHTLAAKKAAVGQREVYDYGTNVATEDGWVIGLNPAKAIGVGHGKQNVGAYRNFLIEFDDLSIEKQHDRIKFLGLPYSTLVFSGNRSIHAVISLQTPLSDEATYRKYFERISFAIAHINDDRTCYSSVFTRLPFFQRLNHYKFSEQRLLDLRRRISIQELEDFLGPTNKSFYRQEALITATYGLKNDANEDDKTKWDLERAAMLDAYIAESDQVGRKLYHSPSRWITTRCPSCEDKGSDSNGTNFGVNLDIHRFKCHKGCPYGEVMDALRGRGYEIELNDDEDEH